MNFRDPGGDFFWGLVITYVRNINPFSASSKLVVQRRCCSKVLGTMPGVYHVSMGALALRRGEKKP